MMEDVVKRYQIPAFGNWEYCDEMPITQYFESAVQAGLVKSHYFGHEDSDLFKVPAPPVKHISYDHHGHHRKVKKAVSVVSGDEKQYSYSREQQKKQGRVCDVTSQTMRRPSRAPKAVDEDLYKIPPELLYQKPKKKRLLSSWWSGCLGVSCVA